MTTVDRSNPGCRAGPILCALSALGCAGCAQGVLDPHGPIAAAQRTILLNSVAIMLTVVVPTIAATLGVAWWYRAGNVHARYRPEWAYSGRIEIVVWTIPAMIILLLGGIAWIGSHDLDPARPIASDVPAVEIQVVALDWKWLFIYPRQGIASVNRLVVPAGAPVALSLTSATVMNSFFVPQLGSQIYTMPGMTTRLSLLADHPGRFPGLSAQFSGEGFSAMRFVLEAEPRERFDAWVDSIRAHGASLDQAGYTALARPGSRTAPAAYGEIDVGLFQRIVEKWKPAGPAVSRDRCTVASVTRGIDEKGR